MEKHYNCFSLLAVGEIRIDEGHNFPSLGGEAIGGSFETMPFKRRKAATNETKTNFLINSRRSVY